MEDAGVQDGSNGNGNSVLIAYFSWGGNTRGIAKLVPDAQMGEGLFIHYFGGNSLTDDVAE